MTICPYCSKWIGNKGVHAEDLTAFSSFLFVISAVSETLLQFAIVGNVGKKMHRKVGIVQLAAIMGKSVGNNQVISTEYTVVG